MIARPCKAYVRRRGIRRAFRVARAAARGCALVVKLAHGAHAQSPATTAWASVGVGSAGSDGLGAGAEGWLDYRNVLLGFHSSSVSEWFGPEKNERSLLIGAAYSQRWARLMVAGGLGESRGSRSNGEQSGTRTELPMTRQPVLEASAQVFSKFAGAHVTVFNIRQGPNSYTLTSVGLVLGYLR